MVDDSKTRRDFLKTTAAAAGATLAASAEAQQTRPADASRILNYNPKMGYRRLGKTDLMISEISLGGHSSGNVANRRAVLKKAAELGMNYVDNNIADECDLYGKALDKDRKNWIIGFASWPEKLTPDYVKEFNADLCYRNIDARLKGYHTDYLDIWRPVGASWGNGQTKQDTMWEVSTKTLDIVVEVFEKVHKAGKVRFLGISGHKPSNFRRVLNEYPQFSMILFPYMFLSTPYGGDSLLALAKEKDVGVIGIKPFAAGATFGDKPTNLKGNVDTRSTSLLKTMLREQRITAVIPGVQLPEQLEQNVKASYTRNEPLTEADHQAWRECLEGYRQQLQGSYANYGWLHQWEVV
jgi:aryl-alcohol dehydrogenase-like predicted oxidoreductase